jgi:hypothetical protein
VVERFIIDRHTGVTRRDDSWTAVAAGEKQKQSPARAVAAARASFISDVCV